MAEMKTKEIERKNAKRKMILLSTLLTILFFIIVSVAITLLLRNHDSPIEYTLPNSYSFEGEILSSNLIQSDLYLVIEEENNILYGIILKNNELISKTVLSENLDRTYIEDYGVVLYDYNNDGNKDFSYIAKREGNEFLYNIYSINEVGEILRIIPDEIRANTNKVSVRVSKTDSGYRYQKTFFYYDGYKVEANIGKHKLEIKSDINKKTISKSSKISIDGTYKALPRKVETQKEFPEYLQNVNNYLTDISEKECIKSDLDGNGDEEYIIAFYMDGNTYVKLLDNSANLVANLMTVEGNREIGNIVEIADVDEDSILEIICVDGSVLEIHKYNNGFYY